MPGQDDVVDTVVIGTGIVGIAVAYYLVIGHGVRHVILVDSRDPMSLTSAQSGENYRNWWPHPVMTAFTDHSIGLMEAIARSTGDRIAMTRRGYALVTRRASPEDLIEDLNRGYQESGGGAIRVHEHGGSGPGYAPNRTARWEDAPDGVDVLCDPAMIRATFPSYADDVSTVLHVRRGGSISGQQMGQLMLEAIRERGGRLVRGEVKEIESGPPFRLRLATPDGDREVRAECLVNAAGPYLADIAEMLGETLPVSCVFQQKISFEDRERAIPRDMPFSIDLDGQRIAWTEDERALLSEDPDHWHLLADMPGAMHCRPDGPEGGSWVKLGWAYNARPSDPHATDPLDPHFPDIVLRAVSRLQPALATYLGRLPRGAHHYGGYYTMTPENWPLIGPMRTSGAFVAGALSGYGTMAACATGSICASWLAGRDLPEYARALSPARSEDPQLMSRLRNASNRGLL